MHRIEIFGFQAITISLLTNNNLLAVCLQDIQNHYSEQKHYPHTPHYLFYQQHPQKDKVLFSPYNYSSPKRKTVPENIPTN